MKNRGKHKEALKYVLCAHVALGFAGAAKGVARQAQQATPDLSGVFDDLAGQVDPCATYTGQECLLVIRALLGGC